MDRRKFLNWFGLVGISSSLPFAIAACSKSLENQRARSLPNEQQAVATAPLETKPRDDGFVPVGSLSALKASVAGAIAPSEIAVVLVRDASNPDAPSAVNPRCTHTGCTVEWHNGLNAFVCPCHNAQFDSKGKVVRGPAEKPLQTYEVKTEGDSVLVKIA